MHGGVHGLAVARSVLPADQRRVLQADDRRVAGEGLLRLRLHRLQRDDRRSGDRLQQRRSFRP